jgi:hypothetical protein
VGGLLALRGALELRRILREGHSLRLAPHHSTHHPLAIRYRFNVLRRLAVTQDGVVAELFDLGLVPGPRILSAVSTRAAFLSGLQRLFGCLYGSSTHVFTLEPFDYFLEFARRSG